MTATNSTRILFRKDQKRRQTEKKKTEMESGRGWEKEDEGVWGEEKQFWRRKFPECQDLLREPRKSRIYFVFRVCSTEGCWEVLAESADCCFCFLFYGSGLLREWQHRGQRHEILFPESC